jgi:hypothetical protein
MAKQTQEVKDELAEIGGLTGLAKRQKNFKESVAKLQEQLGLKPEDYSDFTQQVEPVFSIHIPGDYESVQYLLNEYDDNIKKAKFATDKLKQY